MTKIQFRRGAGLKDSIVSKNPALRRHRLMKIFHLCICFLFMSTVVFSQSESQLRKLLRQFPAADTNGDGKLTAEEARAFMASRSRRGAGQGPPMKFHVDPGWSKAHYRLGQAHTQLGKYAKARDHFQKAEEARTLAAELASRNSHLSSSPGQCSLPEMNRVITASQSWSC